MWLLNTGECESEWKQLSAWWKTCISHCVKAAFQQTVNDLSLLQNLDRAFPLIFFNTDSLFTHCVHNDTPSITCGCISMTQRWVTRWSQTLQCPVWTKKNTFLYRLDQRVFSLSAHHYFMDDLCGCPSAHKHVECQMAPELKFPSPWAPEVPHMWVMKPLQKPEGFFTLSFLIFLSRGFANPVFSDCFYFFSPLIECSSVSPFRPRFRQHACEFWDRAHNAPFSWECFDLEKFHYTGWRQLHVF